jgi:Asp-tRNA(Asn)/Glu-tRNA(Gln) amidotransferase A subunit family amidase
LPPLNDKVRFWTARTVCEAIRAKRISAAEYCRELIAACRTHEGLNAVLALDEARALACAEAADAAPALGPLHGLPVGLKGAIGSDDLPTSAGTPALRDHVPTANAEVAERLIAAGAYTFAKLNQHELSYGVTSNNAAFGAVRNPHDPSRIPGGSSGGCGAAVAAGLMPAALGTDTGGSVRIPAALCGVVGFRPSIGRYSQRGIVPISPTRDTAGPLCRGTDDAALIDAAITGAADTLENLAVGALRLGKPADHFFAALHPDTEAVIEAALERLRAAGCTIIEVEIAGIEAPVAACGFPIAIYETRDALIRYLAETAPGGPSFAQVIAEIASPDVKAILAAMATPAHDDMAGAYRDAMETRRPKLQRILSDCFAANRLDAIVFPTTVLPATPIGEDETVEIGGETLPLFPTFVHNTDPGSTAGIPGVTLPAGLTPAGLPVGLGLDGPSGSDRRLLAVARVLEEILPPISAP